MAKKSTKSTSQTEGLQAESASKLEAIKNLIFGENIQQYDSEFEELKADIINKRNELKNLLDETREELTAAVDNLSTDINIRVTELQDSLESKLDEQDDAKLDRKKFGEMLIQLGNKISD